MSKYQPTEQVQKLIKEGFHYHAPKADQPERYLDINEAALNLVNIIAACSPPGAEQILAIRKIQEGKMWANAAIAIGESSTS